MRVSRNQMTVDPSRIIDLNGSAGNGMNIISVAVNFERQLERAGIPEYDSKQLFNRMINQSYDENVNLLEDRFGDYITIVDVDTDEDTEMDF